MIHHERFFKGFRGDEVYCQSWLPESGTKAVLVINHGWAEHSGRYENVVNKLVPAGIAVFAEDHRGHGKTAGKRSYVERFSWIYEDIHLLITNIIRPQFPELPLLMLGHSMGSVITMNYIGKYSEDVAAVILSGTGMKQGPDISDFLVSLAKLLGVIIPKLTLSAGLDPAFISNDPETVKNYIDDPYRFDFISTRMASELYKGLDSGAMIMKEQTKPILIQCGQDDRSFSKQQELFDSLKATDKTFHFYEHSRHEVYNELPETREKVLNDLLHWINGHI